MRGPECRHQRQLPQRMLRRNRLPMARSGMAKIFERLKGLIYDNLALWTSWSSQDRDYLKLVLQQFVDKARPVPDPRAGAETGYLDEALACNTAYVEELKKRLRKQAEANEGNPRSPPPGVGHQDPL
eukprot:8859546-Pyramimonas_sp.AAC.1